MTQQDLSDLFGDTPTTPKKGVPRMGTAPQQASEAAAAASAAKNAAKPKVTTKGKMAAVGAGAARIMKKKAAAAPAAPAKAQKANAAGKKPVKKAAATAGGTKGSGKFYFAPEDRAALAKLITQKVRKPITTKDFATAQGVETWKVRLAATQLVGEKKLVLKKNGATLTMSPK